MRLLEAAQTFMDGFCATRSLTHPYVIRHFEGMSVMEDGPRKRGEYRSSEYIAVEMAPADVVRLVEADAKVGYAICAVYPGEGPFSQVETEYRAADYRLIVREPFFVHSGDPVPHRPAADIHRVTDPAELAVVVKQARRRQMVPTDLRSDHPRIRLFVAKKDGEICGWVKSIACSNQATWVSDLYVSPNHRRQGIGGGLMSTMLADDRGRGFTSSVLLASHAGAMLYPQLGYERIGTLLLFKGIR